MKKTDRPARPARPPRYARRDVPYRPPREIYDTAGAFGLAVRFFRRYLLPLRWRLAVYIAVATLNACSVYLMSFYAKVVVDDILVVGAAPAEPSPSRATQSGVEGARHPVARERRLAAPLRAFDAHPGRERDASGALSEAYRERHAPARGPNAGGRLLLLFFIYIGTVVALNRGMRQVILLRHKIGSALAINLRNDVHRKVISLSSIYHKSTSPGRLMARILNDVDAVRDHLVINSETIVSQGVMFLVGFTILLSINWISALLVVGAMIPYSLAIRKTRLNMRMYNREIRHSNACLWGLVSQKIDAMKAIFAYGRERAEAVNFFRLSAVMQRDQMRQQHVGATVGRSAQLVSALTTQGIFIYCTVNVLNGSMTLGEMMFIHGAVANLFTPVVNLTNLTVTLSNMLVVMQRLAHMLDSRSVIDEAPDAVPIALPLKQGIRLDNVSFAYDANKPPVLHNIDLTIPAGSWICIMGPSGAGKSTLVGLIARIFDPTSGEIHIDETPLRKVTLHSLRHDMAVVPQEAELFSGTVRDNIAYGHPDATPSAIMAAAKAADSHEFIMNLPVQYETVIGEKGSTLSGGQRQRISIARALLTDPKILILDDCTSALDANTERKIQETLSRLMRERTSIIVSQRVSMAMRCDAILVLENGRVSEFGTHESLVNAGGFYSRLHAQQTR
ncbi:MAG: ABC transporter ATP-binding protein [Kiritimatiellia bacterium]|jgi:ABC-type multidrug transport system fused ATPase/permease subunit